MKYNRTFIMFTSLSIIFFILLTTHACRKKDKDEDKEISQQSSNDNSDAESIFADVYDQVDNGYYKAMNQKNSKDRDCPMVTLSSYDTVTFPKTLTIDFGTTCTGPYGVERKGKIIAVISGKYKNSGTVITISFDNYYRNGNKVEGIKTVTNKGRNTDNHLYYEVKVQDASITNTEGKVIRWNSVRQREWVEGESTNWPNWTDDVYLITGSADGINKAGNAFNVTITKSLRIALNCRYITSGTFSIQTGSDPIINFDYGSGTCDNIATANVNGKIYNITLR